jgi:hypothetical protein
MRPEDKLQKSVATLLKLAGMTFTATANGAFLQGDAKQRAIRGARMKAHGVSNGVPDLLIFDAPLYKGLGPFNPVGCAIELKTGKNKQTEAQEDWEHKLWMCGWRVQVCRSMDEVLWLLKECYPGKFA